MDVVNKQGKQGENAMSLEGQHLGHYRLQRLIGSGSMGEVYLADDSRLPRQVAIKVVRNEVSNYPGSGAVSDAARLFLREAKVIARLDHPHILPLYDYGEEMINGANITFLVMPYRPEGSLGQWLALRGGPIVLSSDEALHIIEQAASALQYAHESGIIHQDVKPANFLLRQNRERPDRPDLLLGDFGVAKLSTGTSNTSQSIRGTPTYMAPEQWSGEPVPATDQYALGVMAYELLTGRPPFQGPPMRMMYLHLHESPLPPSSINPRLPASVDSVILRALAKSPQDRFPSVAAFAQALRQAMQPSTGSPLPGNDLYATLAISQSEAQHGTRRALTLPGGRQVTVNIPAGVQDGQTLRLEGQGKYLTSGEPAGALLLRLSISADRQKVLPTIINEIDRTMPASYPRISPQEVAPVPLRRSSTKTILLVVLAALIVITGTGLLYALVIKPNGTGDTAANSQAAHSTATARVHSVRATSPVGTPETTSDTNADPYPPHSGRLVFNDSLSSNSATSDWQNYSDNNGACWFSGNAYHISYSRANYYLFCTAQTSNFGNFAYQVQMTIVQGDTGGIVFRVDNTSKKFYYFHINTNGDYGLDLYVDNTRANATALATGFSPAIHTGLSQTNVIAVVAIDNTMNLYVNYTHVKTAVDPNNTYSYGQIGLIADSFDTPTEVTFTNVKVWAL